MLKKHVYALMILAEATFFRADAQTLMGSRVRENGTTDPSEVTAMSPGDVYAVSPAALQAISTSAKETPSSPTPAQTTSALLEELSSPAAPTSPESTSQPSSARLRKCCGPTAVYRRGKNGSYSCTAADKYQQLKIDQHPLFSKFVLTYGYPCGQHRSYFVNESRNDRFEILDNGDLKEFDPCVFPDGSPCLYHFGNFCMEYVAEEDKFMPKVCYTEEDVEASTEEDAIRLYTYGLCVSELFLGATLFLYLATPKLRSKLRHKCFLCHLVTLIFGFAFLIGIQNNDATSSYCRFLANMTQFWLLAAFFWLNIMCIDMWRSVKPIESIKVKYLSTHKTFLIYCVYAWGCPLLVFSASYCVNAFLPEGHALRPGFGEENCWFRTFKGYLFYDPKFLFFYGPISITILINFYTFFDTAIIIFFENKSWKLGKMHGSQRHNKERTRFLLYTKLFLVMGLNWSLEVASYYCDDMSGFWKVTDVGNTLQGVLIFLIFICNKQTLLVLERRFMRRRSISRTMSRNTVSDRSRTLSESKGKKMSQSDFGLPGNPTPMTTVTVSCDKEEIRV